MYIILAILAFGVLIVTHELGHFLVAKACGVKVNEFSMGMGPQLWHRQGKETLYSLRALPIGGYCAMEGEDEDTGDPRAFTSRPPWQRVLILCAGAAMNFLLGFLLILCIAPNMNLQEPVLADFLEGCPYEGEDGLQAGDRFYSVDGHRTWFRSDLSYYLSRGSGVHDLVVIRDGRQVRLEDYPLTQVEYPAEDGGTVKLYGFYFAPRETGFAANLRYSWYEALSFVRLIWRSLGDLLTGAVGVRELSGVVGVVDYTNTVTAAAQSTREGLFDFAFIFALIAVNLAVMNMLPFPALDGGRVFFVLLTAVIEAVSRRRLNPKYEGYVHAAGFVLLMGLMVLVMFNDVVKILTR